MLCPGRSPLLQLLNMLEDHFGTYLRGRHRLSGNCGMGSGYFCRGWPRNQGHDLGNDQIRMLKIKILESRRSRHLHQLDYINSIVSRLNFEL